MVATGIAAGQLLEHPEVLEHVLDVLNDMAEGTSRG